MDIFENANKVSLEKMTPVIFISCHGIYSYNILYFLNVSFWFSTYPSQIASFQKAGLPAAKIASSILAPTCTGIHPLLSSPKLFSYTDYCNSLFPSLQNHTIYLGRSGKSKENIYIRCYTNSDKKNIRYLLPLILTLLYCALPSSST